MSFSDLGAHQINSNTSVEEHIPVKLFFRHPKYNRRQFFKNDVTLLQLERPVLLSDKKNIVCLPQNGTVPPYGSDCFVTGGSCDLHALAESFSIVLMLRRVLCLLLEIPPY